VQVSFLINKMNEESTRGGSEGATRKRLRKKIASLSQSQVRYATDALVMIWNYTRELLRPPTTGPNPTVPVTLTNLPLRVQLALLKSIYTGIFIDLQFYAYNEVSNDVPQEPKPLFISSIVSKKLLPAITMRKSGGSPLRSILTCDQRYDGDRFPSCLPSGRANR
jgi:hypothetical protein